MSGKIIVCTTVVYVCSFVYYWTTTTAAAAAVCTVETLCIHVPAKLGVCDTGSRVFQTKPALAGRGGGVNETVAFALFSEYHYV